jgi:hypothetical protein
VNYPRVRHFMRCAGKPTAGQFVVSPCLHDRPPRFPRSTPPSAVIIILVVVRGWSPADVVSVLVTLPPVLVLVASQQVVVPGNCAAGRPRDAVRSTAEDAL